MVLGNPTVDHKVIPPLPGTTVPSIEGEIRKRAAATGRKPPQRSLKSEDMAAITPQDNILVILILSAWDSVQLRFSLCCHLG